MALAQIRVVTDFFHFVVVHDEIKAIRLTTRVVRQYAIDDLGLPKRALDFGTAVAYAHTIEFPWAGGDLHIAHHVLVAGRFYQRDHHAFVMQFQIA